MAKRTGGESLAVDVYDQLRSDIFDRRFAPGQRLKPAELGERVGGRISVMREALGLLAAENLVRIERNRGFHVITLSPDALADLTLARKINEGAALRRAVERGSVSWESEVLAAHHRMGSEPGYRARRPPLPHPALGRRAHRVPGQADRRLRQPGAAGHLPPPVGRGRAVPGLVG